MLTVDGHDVDFCHVQYFKFDQNYSDSMFMKNRLNKKYNEVSTAMKENPL
jgi:hypothetical protein